MLLVDDHQPQASEGDALLHQGMGADRDPRLPGRDAVADRLLLSPGLPAEKQLGADGERLEEMGQRSRVLLREQLRGCHQRGLEVVLHREQHREERDHGLAGAHVAHQEAMHPFRRRHVARDLLERALLVPGQLPGKILPQLGREVALDLEGDAEPLALGDGPRPDEHELQIEQLVEREPPATALRLVRGRRPMHGTERVGQGRKTHGLPIRLRQRVCRQRDEGIEVPLDQRPDDPVAQSLGGRIHRQHLARSERIPIPLRLGQYHVFPGGELSPVVEPHRAGDQQGLPDRDGAVEKSLPGPHALEHPAVVTKHGVEDPKPAPRRQHALRHHAADARHLLPYLCPGEGCDGRGVHVAMREVPQQIAGGVDAESLELVGAPLADPLEEFHRHVEPDGAVGGRGLSGHLGRTTLLHSKVWVLVW